MTEPVSERRLKSRGLRYIFHMMDDWFDIPNLKKGAELRCQIADLVGVPTDFLKQRVLEFVPQANVEVFEEPIDIQRLQTSQKSGLSKRPVVLWCGNPFNLEHIKMLLGILRKVHRQIPFRFRMICGERPPKEFEAGLDFEWLPFQHEMEASLIAGSWVGLAPMPDSGHNRCKGAYKVKTYLASGLPVIASPVGFQKALIQEGPDVGLLPSTSEEWTQSILAMIQNKSTVEAMGERARKYARTRFSYEATGPLWASLLKSKFKIIAGPFSSF